MRTKSTVQVSRKTPRRSHKPSRIVQNRSRNRIQSRRESFIVERLKTNLGQMVARLSAGGKKGERKRACEQIAASLSALAGLDPDRAWGWKYIAGICSGSLQPSKKFIRVFELYDEQLKPRQKQWFYFSRGQRVAAFYENSIRREIICRHLKEMGYKAVSFTRYAEIKHAAIHNKRRRQA